VRTLSPATPGDPEAVPFADPLRGLLSFNPRLDFVIYEVEHPLANKGMEGVDFYPYQLNPGDEATLYGFMGIRGKLTKATGQFTREFDNGVLEFHMQKPKGVNWPGASGGLILDAKNRAIGLVTEAEGDVVQAVPVWAIADFVWHNQRDLYQQLFPHPKEIYQPSWVPPFWATSVEKLETRIESGLSTIEHHMGKGPHSETAPQSFLPEEYLTVQEPIPPLILPQHPLGNRKEEPSEIQRARNEANAMLDRSKNLILEEDVWFGGEDNKEVEAKYEVRVVGGKPTNRLLRDGEQEKFRITYSPSRTGVAPGDAWAAMPGLIASKMNHLPMLPGPDREINGVALKVFRYAANQEDNACLFHARLVIERVVSVPCEGEVWFTENFDMVRMEQRFNPPAWTGWGPWNVVVLYGPSSNPPVSAAQGMLPATIYVEGELLNGRKFHCIAKITKVSGFGVSSRIARASSN